MNATDYNRNKFILFDDRPFYLPLITAFYTLQFLVCIIGNGLLLYILPRMRNPEDYITYALSVLAYSDILFALTQMPKNLLFEIYIDWFLGNFLCKFLQYISVVNSCANVWITVYIAFDRYINFCYPHRLFQIKTKKFCIFVLSIICYGHSVIFCYIFIFTKIIYNKSCNCDICQSVFATKYNLIYTISIDLFYSYALPVMLLLLFYGLIIKSLIKFMSFTNFLRINSKSEDKINISLSDFLFAKVLLFTIIFFIFSNFLLFVTRLWNFIFISIAKQMNSNNNNNNQTSTIGNDNHQPVTQREILLSIAFYLQTIHSCLNPWTYCFYSSKYLNEIKKIISYCNKRESHCQSPTAATALSDSEKSHENNNKINDLKCDFYDDQSTDDQDE